MKAYTDLKQSRKLAEILPHNTADNTWERVTIAGSNLNVPEEQQYVHNGNMPFCYYSGIGVPCWSLAALLEIIPWGQVNRMTNSNKWEASSWTNSNFVPEFYVEGYDNPVDACYEMIIKLNKQKLL